MIKGGSRELQKLGKAEFLRMRNTRSTVKLVDLLIHNILINLIR